MEPKFKKGDRVKILSHPIYVGEEGEFIKYSGKQDVGKGFEKRCEVKLDKYGKQDFPVSDLELL